LPISSATRGHLDVAGAHAAVGLGERQAQHAHLGELRPGLLVVAGLFCGDAPPLVAAVAAVQQGRDGLAEG